MRLRRPPSLPLILTLIALASEVWARAGGGGGFSGGGGGGFSGGGGSSGSGSGGGGGALLYFIVRLCIEKPLIGIPLVITLVAVMVVTKRKGQSAHVSHTIRREVSRFREQAPAADCSALKQRDPAFDETAFIARCQRAFLEIQAAWSQQDMTPVRRFISDGVYSRFQLQLAMQQGSGVRNAVEEVQVTGGRVISVQTDPAFDTIHVLLSATARDTTVALDSGRRVAGSTQPEPFSEVWTFLRRPGTRTHIREGLMEGACPNCGSPILILDRGACGSCRAVVNSGEYDWVLSEITQLEVWQDRRPAQIPGLSAMQAKDPAFCIQGIEDRTSVIFWRLRTAEFFATADTVAAVASPTYLREHAAAFLPDDQGRHHLHADAAVGAVDVSEIVPLSSGTEGVDRVRVRVRWSSHPEARPVPSLMPPNYSLSRFRDQDFLLLRRADVQSQASRALVSDHCPGCGAPHTAVPQAQCEYCGLPQNDGSGDWVLETIEPARRVQVPTPAADPGARMLAEVALSRESAEALLAATVHLMLADGSIDAAELSALQVTANRRGVSGERLDQIMREAQSGARGVLPLQAEDYEEAGAMLQALVHMCLADGNVDPAERRLLKAFVGHLGYADADLDQVIQKERGALYQASKAQRRARRSGEGTP